MTPGITKHIKPETLHFAGRPTENINSPEKSSIPLVAIIDKQFRTYCTEKTRSPSQTRKKSFKWCVTCHRIHSSVCKSTSCNWQWLRIPLHAHWLKIHVQVFVQVWIFWKSILFFLKLTLILCAYTALLPSYNRGPWLAAKLCALLDNLCLKK
jgi:hypothetical protein